MSATATATPQEIRSFVENKETYRCANEVCDGPIPETHVVSKIEPRTGIRTVKVMCPHCGSIYAGKFALRGSFWVLIEPIQHVTDARQIAGMKARVAHVTNVRRAMSH